MSETQEGSLLITPGDIKILEDEIQIPIKKEMLSDEIYYKILREYLKGYKKIILVGKLTDEQMGFIHVIHRRIVGLEVTEQERERIILTDLLKPEDVDLDKITNQMFSFIIAMANDIISYINDSQSPGDKILDRDSVTTRNHNLAYRCCTMSLKDSMYLGKLKKTTDEILIISRIIRYLDMIGTTLVGISYLINEKMTEGMKKYHYKVFERNEEINKNLDKFLKKWLVYFKSIKDALKKKNTEKATKLYLNRFDLVFDIKSNTLKPSEHLTNISNFLEQLSKISSFILRDFIMY